MSNIDLLIELTPDSWKMEIVKGSHFNKSLSYIFRRAVA